MSPEIEANLMRVLHNPRTCPHGNPIPLEHFNTTEYLREQHALRLNTAQPGEQMTVVLISELVEDETAILTQLGQMDIMPGARITLLSRHPDDHTIEASVITRGDTPIAGKQIQLDEDLAAKIWVRSTDEGRKTKDEGS
jgi:DtxR family Mn-dependent transcriptional regulator